jgi:glucose-1-phosphate cytidylyltransferase
MNDITVLILSGGRGTRLGSFTEDSPKPMIKICGLPLIHHLISSILHHNISKFVLLTGYKEDKIREYFKYKAFDSRNIEISNNKSNDLKISINELDKIDSLKILYTGLNSLTELRIFQALSFVKTKYVLILYGDGIGNIDILKLKNFKENSNKKIVITGYRPYQKYGVLEIENGLLQSINQSGRLDCLVNIGYIIIDTEFACNNIENNNVYLEENFLKKQAKLNNIVVYEHFGDWYSVDSMRDHEILEKKLSENENKPFYLC